MSRVRSPPIAPEDTDFTVRRSDGTSTSTAYARYLMSVKLKRYLHDDEEVDHIYNDFTNDSIDNLQILSGSENTKKYLNFHLRSLEHGTYAMYRTGKCRCSLCVEETRKLQRDSYLRNIEKRNARRRFKQKKTVLRSISSVGRAPPLHGGCRRFESCIDHQWSGAANGMPERISVNYVVHGVFMRLDDAGSNPSLPTI